MNCIGAFTIRIKNIGLKIAIKIFQNPVFIYRNIIIGFYDSGIARLSATFGKKDGFFYMDIEALDFFIFQFIRWRFAFCHFWRNRFQIRFNLTPPSHSKKKLSFLSYRKLVFFFISNIKIINRWKRKFLFAAFH